MTFHTSSMRAMQNRGSGQDASCSNAHLGTHCTHTQPLCQLHTCLIHPKVCRVRRCSAELACTVALRVLPLRVLPHTIDLKYSTRNLSLPHRQPWADGHIHTCRWQLRPQLLGAGTARGLTYLHDMSEPPVIVDGLTSEVPHPLDACSGLVPDQTGAPAAAGDGKPYSLMHGVA